MHTSRRLLVLPLGLALVLSLNGQATGVTGPDFSVVGSVTTASPITPGTNITFHYVVTNTTTPTATSTLDITEPTENASTNFVSAKYTMPAGSPTDCSAPSSGHVSCSLPTLAPSAVATVDLIWTSTDVVSLSASATVTAAGDPTAANNTTSPVPVATIQRPVALGITPPASAVNYHDPVPVSAHLVRVTGGTDVSGEHITLWSRAANSVDPFVQKDDQVTDAGGIASLTDSSNPIADQQYEVRHVGTNAYGPATTPDVPAGTVIFTATTTVIDGTSTVFNPGSTVVTGKLTRTADGTGIGGKTLAVLHSDTLTGTYTNAGTTSASSASGAVSFTDTAATHDGFYKLQFTTGDAPHFNSSLSPAGSSRAVAEATSIGYSSPSATIIVPYGDVNLFGTITQVYGTNPPLNSALISLWRRKGAATIWEPANLSTTSNSTGQFSFHLTPNINTYFQFRHSAKTTDPGASGSSFITVMPQIKVKSVMTASITPRYVPPGGKVGITVKVGPAQVGDGVQLQRFYSGAWHTSTGAHLSGASATVFTVAPTVNGDYAYRIRKTSDAEHYESYSNTVRTTVTSTGFGDPAQYNFLCCPSGPARWNPCVSGHVLHYALNLSQAPANAKADVVEALRRISLATGFTFSYAGATSTIPQSTGVYSVPMVIAWARPGQSDALPSGGGAAGVGGFSRAAYYGSTARITNGYAVINSDLNSQFASGFGGPERGKPALGQLLMHELGHMMGMAHVSATGQILYPVVQNSLAAAIYGRGDMSGLRLLGTTRGCN